MKIIRAKDYDQMSRKAANIISAQVIMKPDCVLGLATGSSPLGIYRQLIDWYNKGDVDFSECYSVNLDEYVGLDITSDQSYVYFMHHNFFDSINIRADIDGIKEIVVHKVHITLIAGNIQSHIFIQINRITF